MGEVREAFASQKMKEQLLKVLQLAMILWLAIPSALRAQEFSVASFRQLPNDVSAFINNVRDQIGRAHV